MMLCILINQSMLVLSLIKLHCVKRLYKMQTKHQTPKQNRIQGHTYVLNSNIQPIQRQQYLQANVKVKKNSKSREKVKRKIQTNHLNKQWKMNLRNSKQNHSSSSKLNLKSIMKGNSKESNNRNNSNKQNQILKKTHRNKLKPRDNNALNVKLSQQSASTYRNLISSTQEISKKQSINNLKQNRIKKSVDMSSGTVRQKVQKTQDGIQNQMKLLLTSLKQFPTMEELSKAQVRDTKEQLFRLIQIQRMQNIKRENEIKTLNGKEAKRLEKIHMIQRAQARRNIQVLKKMHQKSIEQQLFGFSGSRVKGVIDLDNS